MKDIDKIVTKYNNFVDSQIKYVEVTSDTSKRIVMSILDDDGEETSIVELNFSGIKESHILQNSVLSFLDMMSGLTILKENDLYGFGLGSGTTMLHVRSAPMYIISTDLNVVEK